jgi:hypothetical protein
MTHFYEDHLPGGSAMRRTKHGHLLSRLRDSIVHWNDAVASGKAIDQLHDRIVGSYGIFELSCSGQGVPAVNGRELLVLVRTRNTTTRETELFVGLAVRHVNARFRTNLKAQIITVQT